MVCTCSCLCTFLFTNSMHANTIYLNIIKNVQCFTGRFFMESIILRQSAKCWHQSQGDEENARNESVACNLRLDVSRSGVLSQTQHGMNSTVFSLSRAVTELFFLAGEAKGKGNPENGDKDRGTELMINLQNSSL